MLHSCLTYLYLTAMQSVDPLLSKHLQAGDGICFFILNVHSQTV